MDFHANWDKIRQNETNSDEFRQTKTNLDEPGRIFKGFFTISHGICHQMITFSHYNQYEKLNFFGHFRVQKINCYFYLGIHSNVSGMT